MRAQLEYETATVCCPSTLLGKGAREEEKKGKLKYVQLTLPYWCLMSRFWRESISQGFIFVISVGNYLKGHQISQFKRSHLNLLVPNFPTFGNCTKDIP